MSGTVVIFIHKLEDDQLVHTLKSENGEKPVKVIPLLDESDFHYFKNYDEEKLYFKYPSDDAEESLLINIVPNETDSDQSNNLTFKPNFPTLIRCQNCETNFPTKYQYQRHQCDFNFQNALITEESKCSDNETGGSEAKNNIFECTICFKIFASRGNLERHRATHNINGSNACEFCGKLFVSENRLKIHKENHCKKAGDISKFYRSDLTVYECKRCHEVFSSADNAYHHIATCLEALDNNDYHENNNCIETISTEILLQCEFCNRTFADKNLLLVHQRKHTTEKNYECVDCNQAFDSYSKAYPHWIKKCNEFSNVFYLPKLSFCEYCDRTFKTHDMLYNHKIKKKHYSPKLFVPKRNQLEKNSLNSCNGVPENKEDINQLIQDVLKSLEVPVSTGSFNADTGKQDAEKTGLNYDGSNSGNEIKESHSHGQAIVKREPESDDSNGEKSYPSLSVPMTEAETDEASKEIARKKRRFTKQTGNNKKNDLLPNDGLRYQCEKCAQVFTCIPSLEQHRNTDHMDTFYCEECGQKVGSAKALLVHYRAHKSLKPYVCDTCGRSYSQTSHLWQHMRFHQGIKPFACPHEGCDARYTIRPDLKDHIRKVHTRERPFKCNVCNKSFLTGSVYYQHRLIHTNDRRYGCEICHKRFFRADALNNHKRIHTDERPYACKVCGREFRQKGDRNKHVKTQHPEHVTP
ncbi:zinc finger protein 62 homolog isoform X2 [Anthonomus grandis grandis]|uniref:zinc finger protein 62 homolog isoform X2 n=1 Tax=Anthonomus grandis grandis TaxID=2921223 RepID=UPI002165B685|nr:zinc finger protein 62 homolog isoform X2 [Anthonomus grandis grandis]